jgi:putative hemolysin
VLVLTLVVLVGLIAANALYVAAEFAAVSVRRSRVHELARAGSAPARLLLPILQNATALDRYVAACQIGITLSSLVLGAYAQATIAVSLVPLFAAWGELQVRAAEALAATLVLVVLTGLQVVFGELVPKSLALQYPTPMALATVYPMRWSLSAFRPFIAVLNGSAIALLRALGMPADGGHRHVHSPEEIELLIAESRDGGLLEHEEQRRLRQALRLSLRSARQLMVPRTSIVGIDIQWPPAQILAAVLASPYTRLPAYDGAIDRVIGFVHTAAVATHYAHRGTLDSIMPLMRPIPAVPEAMRADELLQFLRRERVPQAMVVDEFGGVSGLVTIQDVVAELLGDVGDEYRAPSPGVEQLTDGRVRLSGLLALADAPEWLSDRWRSDAHTVGGHLVNTLGRLPRAGERLILDGLDVQVESLAGHIPGSLVLVPPGEGGDRG